MEKMNRSEKNLKTPKNMIVIEEVKATIVNDALTRALMHYPARVPYNVR